MNEYVRVTRPAGYVGLNESAWLKVPVPAEVVAWASQDPGGNAKPLTSDEWTGLLEAAGLREIAARTYEINTQAEARGILQRYGLGGMLRVWWRILLLYVSSPAYRRFVKKVQEGGVPPHNLEEYFGYGIYV